MNNLYNHNNQNIMQTNLISDSVCCICLEEMNEPENESDNTTFIQNKMVLPKCKHNMHVSCFLEYTKYQIKNANDVPCPLCRDIVINMPPALQIPPFIPHLSYASSRASSNVVAATTITDNHPHAHTAVHIINIENELERQIELRKQKQLFLWAFISFIGTYLALAYVNQTKYL